ncbi:MAG: hypothetical protein LBP72_01400 [Dysgonamonadaceae bacterium]|jgi:hypothetical protein|nr:hypothetical protein [Dysgonamonadaceae bacterium]
MRTIKKVALTVEFVDKLDFDNIRENVLYVNKQTCYAYHDCLCGCKAPVNIPLKKISHDGETYFGDPNGWELTIKGNKVTITPSILNFPCGAHYIITNGIANLV